MKRATIVWLSLAVLSAAGMPLRLPCCSLRRLEATAVQSDCCPIPGCTLAEKQGAAPASIRFGTLVSDPMFQPIAGGLPASPTWPPAMVRVTGASLSPSPPRGRPPSPALLSIYRI